MRDDARIHPFCAKLADFWQTYLPDYRFWQMLSLVAEFFPNRYFRQDPFFAEESDWELAIEEAKKSL